MDLHQDHPFAPWLTHHGAISMAKVTEVTAKSECLKGKSDRVGRRIAGQGKRGFFFSPSSSLKSKSDITSVNSVTALTSWRPLMKAESAVTSVTAGHLIGKVNQPNSSRP